MVSYIKNVIEELRKVTWPKKEETMKNTLIVVGVAIFFGLLFYGISTGTIWVFKEAFSVTGN